MTILIEKDYESMSKAAAKLICQALHKNPRLLLCAASGSTPTGTYKELAIAHHKSPKLFEGLRVLKLDEWIIDDISASSTCETYLKEKLLTPLGIDHDRYFGFDNSAHSAKSECNRMDKVLLQEGPIDLCILGIGTNGHIGLNEPSEKLSLNWHVTDLAIDSMGHPMLNSETKPKKGITLGLDGIFKSRQVILLINGKHKQEITKRFFEQEISSFLPASLLWLHKNVTLICDEDAIATVEKDKLEGMT